MMKGTTLESRVKDRYIHTCKGVRFVVLEG